MSAFLTGVVSRQAPSDFTHYTAVRSSSSAAFSSPCALCSATLAASLVNPMSASRSTFSSSVAACDLCAKFSAQH